MEPQRPSPPPLLQAMLVWGILLASQGMIVLVSQTAVVKPLSPPDQVAPASALGTLNPQLFMIVAAIVALAAFLLPRVLLQSIRRHFMANPPAEVVSREVMARVLPVWIVRWALLESITLLGFVVSMLNNDPPTIYPFAGAALVGFVLSLPNEQKLRAAVS